MNPEIKTLIDAARSASKKARAPYSKFRVGAALLCTDGTIYTGCNVENSSFSLTMCAERVAIFKAVSEGARSFKALVVYTDTQLPTPPCGACRQVLMDLAPGLTCYLADGKGRIRVRRLSALLPEAFKPIQLKRGSRKTK